MQTHQMNDNCVQMCHLRKGWKAICVEESHTADVFDRRRMLLKRTNRTVPLHMIALLISILVIFVHSSCLPQLSCFSVTFPQQDLYQTPVEQQIWILQIVAGSQHVRSRDQAQIKSESNRGCSFSV